MANHDSALKAHRQSLRRRSRNRSNRTECRHSLKKFAALLDDSAVKQANEALGLLYSSVDRAARRKAISKNAAARHKSRLTRRLNALPLKAE